MGQIASEQRVFIVEHYYSNKSPTKVKGAFAIEYSPKINIERNGQQMERRWHLYII